MRFHRRQPTRLPCPWDSPGNKCKPGPGFNSNIFSFLQQKVENGDQRYQSCSLMIKGLSLTQQLQWDPSSHRLQGFMDFGLGTLDADDPRSPGEGGGLCRGGGGLGRDVTACRSAGEPAFRWSSLSTEAVGVARRQGRSGLSGLLYLGLVCVELDCGCLCV